jgi:SnoaL-like domain
MITSEEALLRGPEEIRSFVDRYVEGATRYSWSWRRRDVSSADGVGWLLAEGTEAVASESREEAHAYRMSAVCERRGARWFLMQIHGSLPHTG